MKSNQKTAHLGSLLSRKIFVRTVDKTWEMEQGFQRGSEADTPQCAIRLPFIHTDVRTTVF